MSLKYLQFKYIIVCFNGDPPHTGFASRVGALVNEIANFTGRVLVIRFIPLPHRGRSWRASWTISPRVKLLEIPALPISRIRWLRKPSVIVSSWVLRAIVRLVRPSIIQCECHEAASLGARLNFSGQLYADIHGAAPEEARYAREVAGHNDMSIIPWLDEAEVNITHHFDKIIVVTQNMIGHLESKSGLSLQNKSKVLPIFPDDSFLRPLSKDRWKKHFGLEGRIVFVYSGGMQPYQCIDEMIGWYVALKKRLPNASLMIFTPAIEVAHQKVKTLAGEWAADVLIASIKRSELADYISAADFGFVLREAELLNRVSSPTKAVEYLCRGVRLICTPDAGNAPDYVNRFDAGVVVPLNVSSAALDYAVSQVFGLMKNELPVDEIHRQLSRDGYLELINDLYKLESDGSKVK